jgi:hypothetical protein
VEPNRIPWVFGPPNHKLVEGDEWEAAPIPPLLLDPTLVQFGPVDLDLELEKTMKFTVANTSGQNLRVTIAGSSSGPFRWSAFDQFILNQTRVTLDLKFKPVSTGKATKKLSVVTDAPNSGLPRVRIVTLSGFGSDDSGDPPNLP